MAKKKESKPISVAAVIIAVLIAFAVMAAFLVYIIAPDGEESHSDDLGEQSFGGESSMQPPPEIGEVKEYMADANVGDIVIFGSYEQNGNAEDGLEPIEWQVLEKQEDKLLLISRYCLDTREYKTEQGTVNDWLNGEFFGSAFDETEQGSVVSESDINVFLLNSEQANEYFQYDSWRAATATDYAVSKGARVQNGYTWWWLGESGEAENSFAYVYFNGAVKLQGFDAAFNEVAVRPAIYVSVTAETENYSQGIEN